MPFYKTGKTKDGKQQYRVIVNYTDNNGEYQKITRCTYGRTEAKELEAELEQKVKDKSIYKHMTVQQLYDEYIVSKKSDVRESSLNKTKSILKNHVLNTDLPKKRLDRLTVPVIQQWKNKLGEKDLMLSTKNNAIRELNTMLNYAKKMKYIPENPLKEIGKFADTQLTADCEKVRYYTPEQFKAYIAAAESCRESMIDYYCCVFFYIAFFTGMRKGEIHALKWSDIDGDIIHITRSISQKTKNPDGSYKEGPPKNKASIRSIGIPKKLIDVLTEHKKMMQRSVDNIDDLRICGGMKPISDTTIANRNIKYAEMANLPHRTIHEFRHSHASVLCNNNVNIMIIAKRLGHKDPKTTWKIYAHLYPQADDIAVSALNSIYKKPKRYRIRTKFVHKKERTP